MGSVPLCCAVSRWMTPGHNSYKLHLTKFLSHTETSRPHQLGSSELMKKGLEPTVEAELTSVCTHVGICTHLAPPGPDTHGHQSPHCSSVHQPGEA